MRSLGKGSFQVAPGRTVAHPTGFLSLRIHAADAAGATLDQEIDRMYGLTG